MPLPTLTYELDNWRGLDSYSSETDVDPHYLRACLNVEFDQMGIIAKRRGALKVNITITGAINMIYDFQSQQGFGGDPTDRQRTLIVGGSTLHVVKNFNNAGQTVESTFTTTNALHYATTANNGVCFISNELGGEAPKLLAHVGGSWVFRSAELDAPAIAPVLAAGGGSGLSGTYSAIYTYEDVWGNESNPSPEPASGVLLVNQDLDVGVAASPDPTISHINVYVLAPSASVFHFSGTTDNTSATFTHAISDTELLAGDEADYDHFPAPKGKYVTIYNDMLLVAGDISVPDTVWVSNSQFHRQFTTPSDYARVVSGDGQPVRGFGRLFDQVVIGKADGLHLGEGADNTTFRTRPHNQDYGVLGQPSMAFFNSRLAFFSDDGIYVDDSLRPAEVSEIIRNTLRTLNPANLASTPPKQFSATYKYYKQIFYAVREAAGAGDNDTILVWNYERNAWTRWQGNSARYLAPVQNPDDYEFLYGGNGAGKIYQYTPPNGFSPNVDSISGTATVINAFAETPWINFAKLKAVERWERVRTIPRYMKIYASGEPAPGNSTISLDTAYMVDFDPTIKGTFSTTYSATSWPNVLISPKTLWIGGSLGTFSWVKFRFTNNVLHEHFKIHKIVFGFKLKPPID